MNTMFRQNGQPLLITTTQLERQRRKIIAREKRKAQKAAREALTDSDYVGGRYR